jgi:hypothetical protein
MARPPRRAHPVTRSVGNDLPEGTGRAGLFALRDRVEAWLPRTDWVVAVLLSGATERTDRAADEWSDLDVHATSQSTIGRRAGRYRARGPEVHGGTDRAANLQSLCAAHHRLKTATQDRRWA